MRSLLTGENRGLVGCAQVVDAMGTLSREGREGSGELLEMVLLGRWGRGIYEYHVPASSSLSRAGASRGVSGGVSTPLSMGFASSLLGGVASAASVVVTGGATGAGTGAAAPKK